MYRSIIILSVILAIVWQTGLSQTTTKPQSTDILFDKDPGSGDGKGTFEDDEDLADASGSGSGSGSGYGDVEDSGDKTTPTKMTVTMASTSTTSTSTTTTTSRPPTQCEKSREMSRMLMGGKHHYRCDKNGDFETLQCNRETGMDDCWCSDFEGNEIPGTRMEAPNSPDCDGGYNMPPCVHQLVKHVRNRSMGSFHPQCATDGRFDRVQCWGSMCYCVDEETGKKVEGTDTGLPDHPNCDDDSIPSEPDVSEKPDDEDSKEKDTSEEDKELEIDFSQEEDDKETINVGEEKEESTPSPDINIGTKDDDDEKDKEDDEDSDENETGDDTEDKIHPEVHKSDENRRRVADSQILTQPGLLGGIIGGAVVVLLGLVLLIMFIVYRMRKKDEGSYPLDEPRKVPYAYVRAPDREYYA